MGKHTSASFELRRGEDPRARMVKEIGNLLRYIAIAYDRAVDRGEAVQLPSAIRFTVVAEGWDVHLTAEEEYDSGQLDGKGTAGGDAAGSPT